MVNSFSNAPTLADHNRQLDGAQQQSGASEKQLKFLQTVRNSLSHILEPEEFFLVVGNSVHKIFAYPFVTIYMLQNGEFVLRHAAGFKNSTPQEKLSKEVADKLIHCDQSALILDSQHVADSQSDIVAFSEIAVPLFVRGKVVGTILIQSSANQPLHPQDITITQTLGEYISFGLEQMRLSSEFRNSEQRARALLDTVPDLMFVHGRDGTYLDFHTTRFDRPKVPLETAMGKKIRDIFGIELEQRILPVFAKALDTGELQTFEYTIEEGDGEHYFETRVIAYEPDKVMSLVRDITKEKQVEQLRTQRLRELEEASRAKDEFLATMSHELRTPLHAMLTLNESLREEIYGPISRNQANILSAMEKSGRHLLALINDILDIAKIEAGKLQLDIHRVHVREVLQTSLEIVQESANRKRIQVSQLVDNAIIYIQADERRLVQILVNLLSNAIKFTPDGGTIGVEILSDVETQQVKFVVWDTGIGIAKENREKLFKPFVQLDSSLARQYEGTGLGLALVRRLTELHGGSVNVESTLNKGSRFTVSLPWPEAKSFSETGVHRTSPGLISDSVLPNKLRQLEQDGPIVLLAEDNVTSQEAISSYLAAHSYHVIVANNGAEAIMHAAAIRPDLILMDIQMPEMDGLQATKQIRRNHSLAHIPIVALTALAMPGDRERCLAAGINEYLSKPVSLRHLKQVIETQLTKSTLLPIQ